MRRANCRSCQVSQNFKLCWHLFTQERLANRVFNDLVAPFTSGIFLIDCTAAVAYPSHCTSTNVTTKWEGHSYAHSEASDGTLDFELLSRIKMDWTHWQYPLFDTSLVLYAASLVCWLRQTGQPVILSSVYHARFGCCCCCCCCCYDVHKKTKISGQSQFLGHFLTTTGTTTKTQFLKPSRIS